MDVTWASVLGSTAGGGILGVASKIGVGILNYQQAKMDNAHELAMRDFDLKEVRLEKDAQKFRDRVTAETDRQIAEQQSFASAREHEIKLGGGESQWVQNWRAVIRPGYITIGEIVIVYFWITQPIADIREAIVHAHIAWMSYAIAFYYGGRAYQPPTFGRGATWTGVQPPGKITAAQARALETAFGQPKPESAAAMQRLIDHFRRLVYSVRQRALAAAVAILC